MSSISLAEAAERLDVHYMTAYRYVRLGLLPATKVGGSWQVTEEDLAEFKTPRRSHQEEGAPWSDRLRSRMLAGDVSGSWAVIEAALASGADPAGIYVDVLAPALGEVGEGWARGELSIEDEHIASSVAGRLIGRLGPKFNRRGRPRGTVVTAMPQGERHGFGIAMLADILRGEGFEVLDLGPDTPASALVAALERVDRPAAICISIATDEARPAASEMVKAAKSCLPETPVLAGGRGVPDRAAAVRLGADAWAADPRGVIELLSS